MEKLILESQTFLQLYQDLRQLTSQQFSTMQSQSKFIKIIFGLREFSLSGLRSLLNFPEEISEGSFLSFVASHTLPGSLCLCFS